MTATETYYLRRIADLEHRLANANEEACWRVITALGPYPVWPWRQRILNQVLDAIRGTK